MIYKFEVDRSFFDVKKIWNQIYVNDKEATIYQSYEWNKSFYEKFCANMRLHNLIVYCNNKCVAIFPLIERVCNGILVLEFIGSRMVDYLAPICLEGSKNAVYIEFRQYVIDNNYYFYGYDIKENTLFSKLFFNKEKSIETCCFQKGALIPSNVLKEYEYDKRYLLKNHNFSIVSTNKLEKIYNHIKLYLDNMQNFKNHVIDKELENFWFDFAKDNIENIKLLVLNIEKDLAYSVLYGIKDDTIYLINYAFNVKYKKYAPGKILLTFLMEKYSANYNVDYSRGLDSYKIRFGCLVNNNVKFLYPSNRKLTNFMNKLEFNIGFFPHKL